MSKRYKMAFLALLFSMGLMMFGLKATAQPEAFTSNNQADLLRVELTKVRGELVTLERHTLELASNPEGCSPCKLSSLQKECSGVLARLRRLQSDLKDGKTLAGMSARSRPIDAGPKNSEKSETVAAAVDNSITLK